MRSAAMPRTSFEKVEMETGITIEVISGETEASYIYENHIAENMPKEESYLYIDVEEVARSSLCSVKRSWYLKNLSI